MISVGGALLLAATNCGPTAANPAALRGDWDYYRMLGAAPSGGFDARRRFGFAHFEGADTAGAFINRRADPRLDRIRALTVKGDSLVLGLAGTTSIRAHIGRDTITGIRRRGIFAATTLRKPANTLLLDLPLSQ